MLHALKVRAMKKHHTKRSYEERVNKIDAVRYIGAERYNFELREDSQEFHNWVFYKLVENHSGYKPLNSEAEQRRFSKVEMIDKDNNGYNKSNNTSPHGAFDISESLKCKEQQGEQKIELHLKAQAPIRQTRSIAPIGK